MTIYSPSHDGLTEDQVRAMLAEYPAITPQWRAENALAARRYDRLTATLAERTAARASATPKWSRKAITASGVSRSLRSMDFRPSSPSQKYRREGVFVENGLKLLSSVYEVRISVHIEPQQRREELAEDMATALRGRGYVVKVRHSGIAAYSDLIVTRPEVTA